MNKHKQAGIVLMVLVLVSVFSAWAFAGDLEPSAAPAPTMHTLEEIYNLINGRVDPTAAYVEDTGQTECYDAGGSVISCTGTGQDGELQKGIVWPTPRFADNGDGTVTDHLTGLVWLQNANRFGTRTWAQALSDCNSLADDGADLTDGSAAGDWRLPNVKELQSLIDFGRHNPALPAGHPFSGVQYYYYWSSTTYAANTVLAWRVDVAYGFVDGGNKTNNPYVWPVRGGN